MELIKIAEEIQKKINTLNETKEKLKDYGREKAETIGAYDKALTIIMIKLRNGETIEFEGESITDPPATIIEKIAKGVCYQEKINAELAESNYKSLTTYISCTESQLNAFQSLFRYLEDK